MPTTSSSSLTPLGRHVFIQGPSSDAVPASPNDPTVVVIFGWMSARMSHLKKYVSSYREIYPGSTIFLVRSELHIFCASNSTMDAQFKPMCEVIESLGCLENRQRILTHSFSNGGALHLLAFNRAISLWNKNMAEHAPHNPSALIIDSAPGGETLGRAQNALTAHIKSPIFRRIAKIIVFLVYCFAWTRGQIFGIPSPIAVMLIALRRPRILPWIDARTPRLYVYSHGDEMVPAEDIEAHALLSESAGLDVRRLCFEKSPHVAHARFHPEEYWSAVRKVWADACARVA
ncbi:hypothetical protein FB45DRAFT_820261 [Roridomyces roridus]|uniref:Indole-diterpene biosynthesis protein PaxU n=1 Tax=Roridomyces roridus TaxID=1738132 RepID=A0AAD7CKL5_9AGAR|nr:hypothetical protein FB45DRAFT_820261 [Roridomyces roridus]